MAQDGGYVLRSISLGEVLYVLWLLLSGHFHDALLLGLGGASSVLVLWIAHRMDVVDHEGHPIHLGPRALNYFPWLFKEIALSNLHVARVVLARDLPIQPRLFTVRASQSDELGRVIYANSITLTPGTISVGLESDRLTVHALTAATREGLQSGEMDFRVSAMMGESRPGERA